MLSLTPISIPPPFADLSFGRQDYNLVFGFFPLFACVFLLYILKLVRSHLSFLVVSLILALILFSVFLILFDLLTLFLVILSFLSPLSFSCFCSCSLLLFMLCSSLTSMFFDLLLFDFLIFFVSVEPCSLSFGVSSHCLSNSMSSVLFMYFISSFK